MLFLRLLEEGCGTIDLPPILSFSCSFDTIDVANAAASLADTELLLRFVEDATVAAAADADAAAAASTVAERRASRCTICNLTSSDCCNWTCAASSL